MTRPIRFNRPSIEGHELDYIRAAVEGGHTSSSGPFGSKVAALLREFHGAADVLLTTSCTDALEMSAMMLDLGPGDVVVVPSFTFVSTALAFARQGATLRFCDIEPLTLGLDPVRLEELMDERVKAVVTVHYAGVGSDLIGIQAVLERWPRAELIEDNAHGLFGRYRGRPLGSFGRFSTLSFHETKNFICGEGGALVVNRASDVDRAHVLLDKGTDRRAFLLGQVDKYSWRDIGSSFGLSDVLASYLWGQLEQRDRILARRREVFERYQAALEPHAAELGFRLPVVPGDREQAYHMFYVLLRDRQQRDAVLTYMSERQVQATFHYVPLHSSEAGGRFTDRPADCPVTERVSDTLLRLPFYNDLDGETAEVVIRTFLDAVRASERR